MKKIFIGILILFFTESVSAAEFTEISAGTPTKKTPPPNISSTAKASKIQPDGAKGVKAENVKQSASKSTAKATEKDAENSFILQHNKLIKNAPLESSVTTAAVESEKHQLIRNIPYQHQPTASVTQTTSQGSTPQTPPVANSSRLTACRLRGYEYQGMSAEECNAKGGVIVVTPEVPYVESPPNR